MMKKATWKKLFTRSKSKTRDKNKVEVVCNLCVGMPLADINTLCDRHRNLRTQSGNSISLQNSARDAAVETQKPPSILKSASPTTVAKPAVEPVENSAPVQAAPEKTETFRTVDNSTCSKKDFVEAVVAEAHQDGAVTNEEFMTEEVDSPNLSENSHTENTVPIVIEPEEPNKEDRVIEADGSNAEPTVSHSALLLSDAENLLKDEQTAGVGGASTISDFITNQDDQDRPQRASSYRAHIGNRKAIANLVWFGTANGPEKSSTETPDEVNGECSSHAAPDEQSAESINESTNDASEPSTEHVDAMHNQYVTGTWPNAGSAQHQQASCAPNPTLAEPTPLSTLLPNVYLNAPLNPQTQVESGPVLDGGFDDPAAPGSAKVDTSSAQTSSVNHESSEGSNERQERGDEEGYDDDDQNLDEGFDEDEEGYASDAEESADAHAPSTNQPRSTDMTNTPYRSLSSPENHQGVDGNAPRMVFGTLTSEFSPQPLFFAPNFGVQGMGPINSSNPQENLIGEDSQYPHFSILGMIKDFLPPSAFESQEGRVTEITESTEYNRQSNQQIEESSDLHVQSPPSLEDEDYFDRTGITHMAAEEEKQLKKE